MKKILKVILIIGIVAFFAKGCSLDVNDSPNVATTLNIGNMLTNGQHQMAISFGHASNAIGNIMGVYVQHSTTRERNDFALDVAFMNNPWLIFVNGLPSIDRIIQEGDEQGLYHFAGIGRVMKAFVFMRLADLWGEVPFSQALNPVQFPTPALDRGEDIYNGVFALLRAAKADLAQPANIAFPVGSSDLIYGGDPESWIALANSLMFRMLVNTRDVRHLITGWDGLLAEALAGPMITGGRTRAEATDFEFIFTTTTTPFVERNPAFLASYNVSQISQFPSFWIWEVMNGLTYNHVNNPLVGISDPRVPFYFYRQATDTTDLPIDEAAYRHGGFITIAFGANNSALQTPTAGMMNHVTVWGIYPVGGMFDDGSGESVGIPTTTAGAGGAVPLRFYTFADLMFDKTEMILAGAMPGDARQMFSDALDAAFDHLHRIVYGLPGVPTDVIPDSERDEFRDAILERFDEQSAEGRMHIVKLQKWIHNVNNGVEAFTALRRTGFPVLFNAAHPGSFYDPETSSRERRATENTFPFPNRMPFPNSEVNANPNVQQIDLFNPPKPFWMTVDINVR